MNEPIHPVQLEGLKRGTPEQKIQMVRDLYATGLALRVEGLLLDTRRRRRRSR